MGDFSDFFFFFRLALAAMPKDSPVNGDVWVDSWSHLFGDAMESSPTKKDEKGHVLVCNAMLGVTRAYEDSFQKVLPGR